MKCITNKHRDSHALILVYNHVNVNDDDDSQAVPVRVFRQSGEHLLIVNK